jgi:hypothetical protein
MQEISTMKRFSKHLMHKKISGAQTCEVVFQTSLQCITFRMGRKFLGRQAAHRPQNRMTTYVGRLEFTHSYTLTWTATENKEISVSFGFWGSFPKR